MELQKVPFISKDLDNFSSIFNTSLIKLLFKYFPIRIRIIFINISK